MSWIKIKNALLTAAQQHPNINSFGTGNALAIGTDNTINLRAPVKNRILYPLLFCDPTTYTASRGALDLNVQIYVMDRVENVQNMNAIVSGTAFAGWQSVEDQVLSDMLLVTSDLLAKLTDDPNVTYTLKAGSSGQRFVETRDDIVAGWATSLTFTLPFGMDVCSVPSL